MVCKLKTVLFFVSFGLFVWLLLNTLRTWFKKASICLKHCLSWCFCGFANSVQWWLQIYMPCFPTVLICSCTTWMVFIQSFLCCLAHKETARFLWCCFHCTMIFLQSRLASPMSNPLPFSFGLETVSRNLFCYVLASVFLQNTKNTHLFSCKIPRIPGSQHCYLYSVNLLFFLFFFKQQEAAASAAADAADASLTIKETAAVAGGGDSECSTEVKPDQASSAGSGEQDAPDAVSQPASQTDSQPASQSDKEAGQVSAS